MWTSADLENLVREKLGNYLQIGEISRIHVQKYKDVNDEINAIVERINWKHSTENWTPVVLTRRHVSYEEIIALYRLSSVCMVTSLHDGMNLVAKEFVSSKIDGTGVLMLSDFTGAARELTDALVVNPYDREQCAEALHRALAMPEKARFYPPAKRALERLSRLPGVRTGAGKKVLELRAKADFHKGAACRLILARNGGAGFYMGDDVTDEDAFRALRGRAVTVFVGPAGKKTAASHRVPCPEAAAALLGKILSRARETGRPERAGTPRRGGS
ncbi:MAG: trehalose 6-phosphate synthase [Elusimicrobia bacterium]|nr:MAG: trehalose 6-phosphate synthase [Elusimicrobiota bacterium]KAF0156831.1 MAG: trehalose 6-phosphate synthase [Elusimicrobiota bacterium]